MYTVALELFITTYWGLRLLGCLLWEPEIVNFVIVLNNLDLVVKIAH